MAPNARRSQRVAAGPIGLGVVVSLLAACSLIAPATFAPQQSLARESDAPTPLITPRPTATILPPLSPSLEPSPSPGLAAGSWRGVTKRLTSPAAWLDCGFAANGHLLALGTQDAAAHRLHLLFP